MAIIYTYGYDSNISGTDALIGTDSTGRKTKQFRVSDLTDYISDNISVVAGVNTITTIDGKFISLTPNTPQNGDVIITAVLSASGTSNETTYLRGDNTWATIPSGEDNYVDSISFNTGTGDLTLGRTGVLPDLVQSLDGRYALSGAAGVTYDLASSQNVNDVDITLTGSDASVDTVTLVAGTNITLTDDGSNNITIDADAAAGGEADFVYFTVKNETGVTINKGKGVMAVGTDGNSGHILIDEMIGDGTVEAKFFLGVLETSVDNGNFARVISFGRLDQFNTNGQNGETWNNGDILWCDPDSPGDFTIVEPDGPNVKIAAAIVLNASTNGKIQIRVQANEGVHDLHDTRIIDQNPGEILVWNNEDGVWFNNGTLHVDYTNGNIGIGNEAPSARLDVSGGVKIGNDTDAGVNTKSGTLRYRSDSNNSYLEMCMQTGPNIADFAWVVIKQNSW
jgi:hypothetical protein